LIHAFNWKKPSVAAALAFRWDGRRSQLFFQTCPGSHDIKRAASVEVYTRLAEGYTATWGRRFAGSTPGGPDADQRRTHSTRDGNDECDPATGRGRVNLQREGSLTGHIYFHQGDDPGFRAIPFGDDEQPTAKASPTAK